MKRISMLIALGLVATPALAMAQTADDDPQKEASPYDKPDEDPIPEPPKPEIVKKDAAIEKQAGTGGTIAYSEAGVVELGGSAGFSMAGEITTGSLRPQVGWFVADNFQISGLMDFTYADAGDDDAMRVSVLAEPSYHLPFTDNVFGFAGIGAGVQYAEGAGTGLAVVPRVGMNLLVGRSGVFTPSVNVGYSTVDADATSNGTLLTVEPSVGVSAGYTVMW